MSAIAEAFRGAAVGLTSWAFALQLLSGSTRARIGQLAVTDRHGSLAVNTLSGASADEIAAYVAAGGTDPALNPRTQGVIRAPLLSSIVDADFIDEAGRDRSPIYRSLFRQSEVPFSLQIRLPNPDGLSVLALQRPHSSGEADLAERRWLEALAPAITGAVGIGMALGRGEDERLMTTAERLDGHVILLGADLSVISLSPPAEQAVRAGTALSVRSGRLVAIDPRSQAALERTFRHVTSLPETGAARIVLRRRDGTGLPADLAALPVRGSGPLSGARALLVLRLPRRVGDAQALRDIRHGLGLTPAEADIALLLTDGLTVAQIADRRGSTPTTVKGQLKGIFQKAGVRRQAELVMMLQPYRFL